MGQNNFHTESYNKEKHCKYINKWLKIRGMDRSLAKDLPELGAISFYGDIPVSASFVRKVEGNGFGLIDSMISDPRVDAQVRNTANDFVTAHVLTLARRRGYLKLVGFSEDKWTVMRSITFGFVESPHTVILIDLS